MGVQHLESLRQFEVERVKDWLRPGMRVLEIGGGHGFQASIIASWGCDVVSIDIGTVPPREIQRYPVQQYDGKKIPFPNHLFDIVFSSNVLEHVKDLESLLGESRRVLSGGGMAIHILPSPSWRVWTSLAHYVYVASRVIGKSLPVSGGVVPSVSEKIQHRGLWYVIARSLMAGPHGEYPSALSEMYYFSKYRWKNVFHVAGFEIVRTLTSGLFYTGYALLPTLSLESRKKIAKVFGSATYIYILRPQVPNSSQSG